MPRTTFHGQSISTSNDYIRIRENHYHSSRVLNSELARKLRARQGQQINYRNSIRNNESDNINEKIENCNNNEGGLSSILAPLSSVVMSCQHPDAPVTDLISPGSTQGIRRYPLPDPDPTLIPKSDLGSSCPTTEASHFRSFFPVTSDACSEASCAPSSILLGESTAATCPFETVGTLERAFASFFSEPGASVSSSLATCAPPSAILAASTSTTCQNTNAYGSDSSLETCAPFSNIIAASTSATCPSTETRARMNREKQRALSNKGDNDHRDDHAERSRNFLRLINDLDDGGNRKHWRRKENRRQTRRAGRSEIFQGHSSNRQLPRFLSAFHRAKRGSKGNVPSDVYASCDDVTPSNLFNPSHSLRRGAPVDLDDSVDDAVSRCQNNDNDPDAGYHSEPTEVELRNCNVTVDISGSALPTPTFTPACRDVLPMNGSKFLNNERVLSQLGMDVREEDYCIEGEYSSARLPSGEYHPPPSSGKWNCHDERPSYVNDGGPNLTFGEVLMSGETEKEVQRRRSGDLGGNFKVGMKKINVRARQTIGSMIHKSAGDDAHVESSAPRISDNPTNNGVFGSKVLSMLRGRANTLSSSTPPQIITITPTSSEDPDSMTTEELKLVRQWQMARARREGAVGSSHLLVTAATPDGDGGSGVLNCVSANVISIWRSTNNNVNNRKCNDEVSTAMNSQGDRTVTRDNRGHCDKPRHKTEFSF